MSRLKRQPTDTNVLYFEYRKIENKVVTNNRVMMKLTVLVDNNTFIDQYYLGEPAVCYYIEDGETKILLDAGLSLIHI